MQDSILFYCNVLSVAIRVQIWIKNLIFQQSQKIMEKTLQDFTNIFRKYSRNRMHNNLFILQIVVFHACNVKIFLGSWKSKI